MFVVRRLRDGAYRGRAGWVPDRATALEFEPAPADGFELAAAACEDAEAAGDECLVLYSPGLADRKSTARYERPGGAASPPNDGTVRSLRPPPRKKICT